MSFPNHIPYVSVTYARGGSATRANELGMRPMQERAYQERGEPSSSHTFSSQRGRGRSRGSLRAA